MQKISLAIIFPTLLVAMVYAASPNAPHLDISVDGLNVSVKWNNISTALGYQLYYAPYPQAEPIGNIDIKSQLGFSATLPLNAAFYIAVKAYNSEGYSDYSNLEHFILNEQGNSSVPNVPANTNEHKKGKMLIVISAPSINDPYYKDNFQRIIDFDIQFAKSILGKDNVVVLVDKETLSYFKDKLPKDVLLEAYVNDIWIRDFSTVHPSKMIKFAYDRPDTPSIDKSFRAFTKENELHFKESNLKIDGGNVVDNNNGKLILTDKIMERNPQLTTPSLISKLKQELGATEIAIIPMDEEYLGHSDGMVMFVDENTVIMNNYKGDPSFKNSVLSTLRKGLPHAKIVEIDGAGYGEAYGAYASACGIYVNSVVTYNYIYMPIFGKAAEDNAAMQTIQSNTNKTVVTVNAKNVCFLGGNTRCLSWQITGDNARKIIEAARLY
jgi:agmatine/peptidylarginine deiminase